MLVCVGPSWDPKHRFSREATQFIVSFTLAQGCLGKVVSKPSLSGYI